MRKIILNLLNKSMDWLKRKHDLLQKPEQDAGLGAVYCSLSPIDNADEDKHYTKALSWALNTRKENDIRNIALTGPYGSGKSSVLKTFQKNYTGNDFHFLNISLATFKEEAPKIENEKPDQPKTEDEDSDQPNPLHTADKRRKHANTDDTLRLIELSILQQIFYHAHDDEIPDSRFKKIKGLPKWTALNRTIGVSLFVVSLLILFHEHLPSYIRDAVDNQFSGFWIYIAAVLLITGLSYFFLFYIDKSNKKFRFKTPLGLLGLNALLFIYIVGAELDSHDTIQTLIGWDEREFGNLLATLSVVYAISFLLYSIYRIVKYVSRVSINKLKFQDAEIEIDGKVNKSILNHHLDEIIYFFEVTPYNVVIIEDLDRFQQTEIFTKLREINLLLNNSKKTKHKEIVFVYAVRDDMFTDKERTKFFDFIIPIIPVINSSNSSQKLLEKTTLHGYQWSEDLIDSLALFVDDMRLLHNITNEFHLYKNKLTGKLIPDVYSD